MRLRLDAKLLQAHWEVTYALSCRVKHCVANRRIGADIPELAKPFDTGRIDLIVLFEEQDNFDAGCIRVNRHQVVGEVVIDIARVAFVDLGCLEQSRGRLNGIRNSNLLGSLANEVFMAGSSPQH